MASLVVTREKARETGEDELSFVDSFVPPSPAKVLIRGLIQTRAKLWNCFREDPQVTAGASDKRFPRAEVRRDLIKRGSNEPRGSSHLLPAKIFLRYLPPRRLLG